jgi:hypothetical protein
MVSWHQGLRVLLLTAHNENEAYQCLERNAKHAFDILHSASNLEQFMTCRPCREIFPLMYDLRGMKQFQVSNSLHVELEQSA